jgi:Fic family protein
MQSFRDLARRFGQTPAPVGRLLSDIDVARGREMAFRLQHPEALKALVEIALVQSVEASNAIENITAPLKRIEQLVEEKTTPRNRSEEEIAGYRSVLSTIHSSATHIPLKPNTIEQLHRDLYQFSPTRGGTFKGTDNTVEEVMSDGTRRIRFQPVGWFETPAAVEELCAGFTRARDSDAYSPLLLIAAFTLDFLVIHPFSDGNGRMSRLLTLLLLYQSDIDVGRFISIEKLIEDTKESYYQGLEASTAGWHEGQHDLEPWTRYFLGVILAAYRRFEDRAGMMVAARGAKAEMVKDFVRSSLSDTFKVQDVRQAVPSASDVYIRQLLRQLKASGVLDQVGRGQHASWRRLHNDF